jgi:hypothetical protein
MTDSQTILEVTSSQNNPYARNTIFISHATPDDNDFVRWLGSRLTGHGYKVWADLFELKGGTPFWSSIEEALRHHACKVIFVVSKKSIDPARSGVRNELSVADTIRKMLNDPGFIIPVRIDNTDFGDLPIQVHQLNAIDFSKGWGIKLVELLETLEHAHVPRSPNELTAEFEKWRDTVVKTSVAVESNPEQVLTNLSPIESLPKMISFYSHQHDVDAVVKALRATGIPFAPYFRLIIAFADMSSLQDGIGPLLKLSARAHVPLTDFIAGTVECVTSPPRDEAKKIATALLKKHVERHLEKIGLRRFETSTSSTFYFPVGLVPNNKVPYRAASGRNTNKNVVGRSERNKVYWHLSMKINVTLGLVPMIRFKPYVCFSEDGQSAIGDTKRTSAIRRRFCRNWWNQHWRQLQEAFCVFLANEKNVAEIDLDGPENLVIAGKLLELTAVRKLPDDFNFMEEADDPVEPDLEESDDLEGLEDSDVEYAV